MAIVIMKACKQCSMVGEADVCPNCGGQTSKEWQGYVIILDYTKSDIAKKLGITANGRFALRVR